MTKLTRHLNLVVREVAVVGAMITFQSPFKKIKGSVYNNSPEDGQDQTSKNEEDSGPVHTIVESLRLPKLREHNFSRGVYVRSLNASQLKYPRMAEQMTNRMSITNVFPEPENGIPIVMSKIAAKATSPETTIDPMTTFLGRSFILNLGSTKNVIGIAIA